MAEWAKIDVNFLRHPQVIGLKPQDQLAFLALILYAMEYETDGDIPAACLPACNVTTKSTAALERARLISQTDDGWHVDGFTRKQRTRQELDIERKANRERAQAMRQRKSMRVVS